MLFHMVASVLFSMAALSTAIAKILIGCWRILTNQRMVEKAAMESKTEVTMWKSIKNWIRKWCHKWVYILFGVTYRKNSVHYLLLKDPRVWPQWPQPHRRPQIQPGSSGGGWAQAVWPLLQRVLQRNLLATLSLHAGQGHLQDRLLECKEFFRKSSLVLQ